MGDEIASSSGSSNISITHPTTASLPNFTAANDTNISLSSSSFPSTATTTQSPAASASRPAIHHNGLHPLHPSSSSATLSLSAPQLHTETPEQCKVGQYIARSDTIIPPSRSYQKKHLAAHRTWTRPLSDENDSACSGCGKGGELLCCDRAGCVRVWHLICVGLRAVPKRQWHCPECRTSKKGGRHHSEERKENGEAAVSKKAAGLKRTAVKRTTAPKSTGLRRSSWSEEGEEAVVSQRAARKAHTRQWDDPLEREVVDVNDWQIETKEERADDEEDERRGEKQQRLGVKWSLRPLRPKRSEEKEEEAVVKFEDEDGDEVRRMEMKHRSDDDEADDDYQQEDTPEEESEEDIDAVAEEEVVDEEEEVVEELLPDEYDERQPLAYRRYRRSVDSYSDADNGKKKVGFCKQNKGKRTRDAVERGGKKKRAHLEKEERWSAVELPLDDEEAREDIHQWMSSSRKRGMRSKPDGEWRYQQDDERLEEEGATAEKRAEREHDTTERNEQRNQQQKQKEESMRRARMWNSNAIYAILQQLDTLTLLQLVATTIERMGGDVRIQALTTAAPSLQSLLSTVTATSIAEAYVSAPPTSPPSFPPPPPTFSAFLASLHALVVASVTHHSAELHTYRFFVLRQLDWQWRQYIRQHTQTINSLRVQMEARERSDYQIQSEMKAEERECEEWRKQFSHHWEVAQRMHDRLEAEERELREWNEWCEAKQKEAEEDEGEITVELEEKREERNETEVAARLEARRDKSGMLIVALCMCLLIKWRAMGPIKDIRKAFDAIIAPTPPADPPSPPLSTQTTAERSTTAAMSGNDGSLQPSSPDALHGDEDVNGDDGFVNLGHTIILSNETSPPHSEAPIGEAEGERPDGPAEEAYHEVDIMYDDQAHDGPASPLHDEQQDDMAETKQMSADDTFSGECDAAVNIEVGAVVEREDCARLTSHSPRRSTTHEQLTAAASEATTASGSSSPQPTPDSGKVDTDFFLPFLSLPVLTADGLESHTLTEFPAVTGQLPLLPIAVEWTDGIVATDAEKASSGTQPAAVSTEQSDAEFCTAADVDNTAALSDEPAAASAPTADEESQPCRHTCGCAEPPDTLFADRRPHERDRVLHPLCSKRSMECTALFKTTPVEQAKLAAASRAKRDRRFFVTALKTCRHKCGCSLSRHKRFDPNGRLTHERDESLHIHCKSLGLECATYIYRVSHEAKHSKHPQCTEKGLECVAFLSTIDDREARVARQAELQQREDEGELDDEEEEEEEAQSEARSAKKQRVLLSPQNATLEVSSSKRFMPCLHRTSRCDAHCQTRFPTAHEAVQHATTAHRDCKCGGRTLKTWRKLAEKWIAKQEEKRMRKHKRRKNKERRDKRNDKKRRDKNRDEQSDHSSSSPDSHTSPFSQSHSSASMPSSP